MSNSSTRITEVAEQAIKKEVTKKRSGKGNPQAYKNSKLGDGMFNFKGGEISALMQQALDIKSWGPINLDSDEEVDNRINEYWIYCAERDARPMVSGMALALGIDRATLNAWKNGTRRGGPCSSRVDIIKKAYNILEFMWEQYMQTGKINPASGCFLGKNNFGYVDEMKLEVAPQQQLEATNTPDQIAEQIPIDVEEVE